MTDTSKFAVHLYRFDDTFQCWELQAAFNLYSPAAVAAQALSAASKVNSTFSVVDARKPANGGRHTFFYRNGEDLGLINPTGVEV